MLHVHPASGLTVVTSASLDRPLDSLFELREGALMGPFAAVDARFVMPRSLGS